MKTKEAERESHFTFNPYLPTYVIQIRMHSRIETGWTFSMEQKFDSIWLTTTGIFFIDENIGILKAFWVTRICPNLTKARITIFYNKMISEEAF